MPIEAAKFIPWIPLLGSVLCCLCCTRKQLAGFAGPICVLSIFASFLLSLATFGNVPAQGVSVTFFPWFEAGAFSADVGYYLDTLTYLMLFVVTGIGTLIAWYATGYMKGDRGYARFFAGMCIFIFAMTNLVMADNLVLLYLGWEGVGFASWFLIGFYYDKMFAVAAAKKAFIVNRIGDLGFALGLFLTYQEFGSVKYDDIFAAAAPYVTGENTATLGMLVIPFLLMLGAFGKSAQIPLYVWLPDAMAGPTPVSALIHAATMVTAGVYMVCRMNFLYAEAPGASALIAWTGALTALVAATIAIAQTDIKKVLAYSTVSQLGYMFLAAGCGGYSAAVFHLGTHAFFKALLFLGSGAVILAMHHEQDTDKMGGLRRYIPKTHFVFGIGVLAIAGLPPLSGFFSKDEVLLSAFASHVPGHQALYAIGLLTAVLTAFYMFRVHLRTFYGECRAPAEVRSHIHEPASTVLVPLYVLAVLSAVAGLLSPPQLWGDLMGIESSNSLHHFLAPVLSHGAEHHVPHSTEWLLVAAAVAAALLGGGLAIWMYHLRPELPVRIREAASGLHAAVANKYWVDEAYDAAIVRPLVAVSDRVLFRGVDARGIDGAVNGGAAAVRALAARGLKYAQTGLAQSYLIVMIVGTLAMLGWMLAG